MKFSGLSVLDLVEKNLRIARKKLAELPVYCGNEPTFGDLHGWVFEQTVQWCLLHELATFGLKPEIEEQVKLTGRAKVDFRVGRVMVELKTGGLFSMGDVAKYRRYRQTAESLGYRYLFVSKYEDCERYQPRILKGIGRENVFNLNQPNHWKRFVQAVRKELLRGRRLSTSAA